MGTHKLTVTENELTVTLAGYSKSLDNTLKTSTIPPKKGSSTNCQLLVLKFHRRDFISRQEALNDYHYFFVIISKHFNVCSSPTHSSIDRKYTTPEASGKEIR